MSIFPIIDLDIVYIKQLSLEDKLKMKQCNKYYDELCNDIIIKEYHDYIKRKDENKVNIDDEYHYLFSKFTDICLFELFNLADYLLKYNNIHPYEFGNVYEVAVFCGNSKTIEYIDKLSDDKNKLKQ